MWFRCPDSLFKHYLFWTHLCISVCTSQALKRSPHLKTCDYPFSLRVVQQNVCFPSSPASLCMRQLIYYISFDLKLIMVHTVKSSTTSSFCSGSSLLVLWHFRCVLVRKLSCCSCWVHGLVFPRTAVSSFISEAESVRKLLLSETFLLVLQSLLQLGEMFFFGMTTLLTNGWLAGSSPFDVQVAMHGEVAQVRTELILQVQMSLSAVVVFQPVIQGLGLVRTSYWIL